MKVKKTLT